MIEDMCPNCGARLTHVEYTTYPSIPGVVCPQCGFRAERKQQKIEQRVFEVPPDWAVTSPGVDVAKGQMETTS